MAEIKHREFVPVGTQRELEERGRARAKKVNQNLVKNGIPIYVWEVCGAEEFINVWLPKFERGELAPEDSPITGYELEQQ